MAASKDNETMEMRFPRQIDALDNIFGFIATFLSAHELEEAEAFPIDLVVEEIFTNFVRHNTDGSGPIAIRLDRDEDRIVIALTDYGVREFDPTKAPAADTESSLGRRQPGGLGIHFLREIADTLAYAYEDGNSTVTVTKRLES
jgi:anti-sigma regulatory factor (Ser/Thr protein kinase)